MGGVRDRIAKTDYQSCHGWEPANYGGYQPSRLRFKGDPRARRFDYLIISTEANPFRCREGDWGSWNAEPAGQERPGRPSFRVPQVPGFRRRPTPCQETASCVFAIEFALTHAERSMTGHMEILRLEEVMESSLHDTVQE